MHAGSALGIYLAVKDEISPGTAKRSIAFAAPAALVGVLAHKQVEKRLGGIGATAALLAAGGVAMWLADRQPDDRSLDSAALNVAALAQVAALAPGVSRGGATLTALRAQGVDREEALRHTSHSSLPITIGAAAFTAVKARRAPALVPGAAAAGTAYLTARAVRGESKRLITGAAIYRLVVAALVAARLRRESAA